MFPSPGLGAFTASTGSLYRMEASRGDLDEMKRSEEASSVQKRTVSLFCVVVTIRAPSTARTPSKGQVLTVTTRRLDLLFVENGSFFTP